MKKIIIILFVFSFFFPSYIVDAAELTNDKTYDIGADVDVVIDSNKNIITVSNGLLTKKSIDGTILWSKSFSNDYSDMHGVTVDNNDNIYITIHHLENPVLPGVTLVSSKCNNVSFFEIIKYSASGDLIFEKKISLNSEIIKIYNIVAIRYFDGYIYVSGYERLDIHFLGYETSSYETEYAKYEYIQKDVVMKLDLDGNPIWKVNYGVEDNGSMLFLVSGSCSTFSYTTFNRKKIIFDMDLNGNLFVLKYKKVGYEEETILFSKIDSSGNLVFSKRLDSSIKVSDLFVYHDNIVLVGKKNQELIPPEQILTWNERSLLSEKEKKLYDLSVTASYNPYLIFYDFDGNVVNEMVYSDYDRSLFNSAVVLNDRFIVQMCSYNYDSLQHECYEILLNSDLNGWQQLSDVNYVYTDVDFYYNYTLEEDILDEDENQYYILSLTNLENNKSVLQINTIYFFNGSIELDDKQGYANYNISMSENVLEGEKVSFMLSVPFGFILDDINIVDGNNNVVEFNKINSFEYEFIMPSSNLLITPVYHKIDLLNPLTGNFFIYIMCVVLIVSFIFLVELLLKKKKSNQMI